MKYFKKIKSPVGPLTLVATDQNLIAVVWENQQAPSANPECKASPNHPILKETESQLKEYFAGKRTTFDLPTEALGSAFQGKVWQALRSIPYGETWSYSKLAKTIGNAKASRAVGGANGRNPLSIIVPCHRVIGANGSLTGFAGGTKTKAILLDLEQKYLARN